MSWSKYLILLGSLVLVFFMRDPDHLASMPLSATAQPTMQAVSQATAAATQATNIVPAAGKWSPSETEFRFQLLRTGNSVFKIDFSIADDNKRVNGQFRIKFTVADDQTAVSGTTTFDDGPFAATADWTAPIVNGLFLAQIKASMSQGASSNLQYVAILAGVFTDGNAVKGIAVVSQPGVFYTPISWDITVPKKK